MSLMICLALASLLATIRREIPFVLLVGNMQPVIERIEELAGLVLRDHQRRREEQRGLLAAGSDHGARLQGAQRHARGNRFLLGVGIPQTPVRPVQLDRPMQALPPYALHAWMPPRNLEQALGEHGLKLAYTGQNIFVGDDAEVGADRGHANRVTTQRSVVLPTL